MSAATLPGRSRAVGAVRPPPVLYANPSPLPIFPHPTNCLQISCIACPNAPAPMPLPQWPCPYRCPACTDSPSPWRPCLCLTARCESCEPTRAGARARGALTALTQAIGRVSRALARGTGRGQERVRLAVWLAGKMWCSGMQGRRASGGLQGGGTQQASERERRAGDGGAAGRVARAGGQAIIQAGGGAQHRQTGRAAHGGAPGEGAQARRQRAASESGAAPAGPRPHRPGPQASAFFFFFF